MATFTVPRFTHFGLGCLDELKKLKGKKAVIVTGGSSMKRGGFIAKTAAYLQEAGIASAVFEGVEPDPSIQTVKRGVDFFNKEEPDLIIGLGGCSAIDASKAMWVFYEYPEAKFEDITPPFSIKPLRNKARFIAIPSTSGTGTEVTCATVITDRVKGVKYPIVSYEITPDIAIVDGELCLSMPDHVTANTGLDALAHDVEAYVTGLASSFTDTLVHDSVRMIFENLPKAYADGSDREARQAMHEASCMAGMAFSNAILGIIHSMAHQLGGMFHIPHGCANAILMPNAIRYNSKATAKYERLAPIVGAEGVEGLVGAIEELRAKVNVPATIKEYGIAEAEWLEKLDTISANALADPCTGTNPRQPVGDEIKRIFTCCYNGEKVDF